LGVNGKSGSRPREVDRVRIDTTVSSLAWDGDVVRDLARNQAYGLDGSRHDPRFFWGYPFDVALVGRSGVVALAHRRGTKGLVAWSESRGRFREIDRAFYLADRYDYPIPS
jgi:hypothetical protein